MVAVNVEHTYGKGNIFMYFLSGYNVLLVILDLAQFCNI